ncbi:LytR/AlgR family response regulator transcription factor [Vibrio mediterranei]|uniref:LytR/AlgR family response regulator transcription factor n=1 Tax=Vibrio mediterranei TaxID=689 RepID=UPI0022843EFE|nr:LytTR family DNA-binding domain-containing protein [Vibrio mediterranei]MCY9852545.1 LytTR family DNA-binding domain-containing protein [Vibrio mediterranei]
MKTAILVEDEYLASEELKYLIHKYSDLELVGEFDDGLKAFEYLQSAQVDVAFLDINVPSINGMLLAKSLYNSKSQPKIIFTTAYREHAAEAFEIEAFDYLLKPYTEERVQKTLQKLSQKLPLTNNQLSGNSITLYQGSRIRVIEKSDIIFAEADGKITQVLTTHGIFSSPVMFSEFVEKNKTTRFFKAHRSFWVNLDKIEEITPWHSGTYRIKLRGSDKQIPVSRSNIKAFRDSIGL